VKNILRVGGPFGESSGDSAEAGFAEPNNERTGL
jgi:hypothetical protein